MAALTLRLIQARYDRLRLRYFMDAEPPLRIPPPASELRWYWTPEKGPNWALTHFDVDGDPDSIGIDPGVKGSAKLATTVLLHELTHIRNPKLNCGGNGKAPRAWMLEQARLTAMGASLL